MKPRLKAVLRTWKRRLLAARRTAARSVVASLHRAARRDHRNPFLIRLLLAVYFVKRTLQETLVRNWPLTRFRRARWRCEVETAFTMKLLRWSHDPLDLTDNAYPLHRFNNRVTNADRVAMEATSARWEARPLVSLLVPVYNAAPAWLDRLIASVTDQVYDRWELVLVDDASPNPNVWPALQSWAERDPRIVLERSPSNHGVAAATNRAAELASGEFLVFADHDDELTSDALWWMVEALQGAADVDLVYSDEEIVPTDAPPYPMFKPGWSPELLVSFNYICHLAMVRRSVFDAVGGLRLGFDGAQDHDLLLRLSRNLRRVVHVPRILYRWHVGDASMSRRVEQKTGQVVAASGIADKTRRVVQAHLDRQNLDGEATTISGWCLPRYRPSDRGKATIIIPTKDNADCLRAAVQSIESKTDYPNYELLIIDTGAESAEARALHDELATRRRVVRFDNGGERFNWSRVNNWAAEQTDGDFLVFLNDDVEVQEPGWLSALVAVAAQPQVGAVGALLEYPDGRIQHAGVILGAHGWGPWHVLMGAHLRQPTDYQGMAYFQRNCLAVTGACLAIRRELFADLGGFDADKLAVGFSDVDLCIRLHRKGYRNAYLPQARLIHKEGQSRGMTIDATEAAELASRTAGLVDPYWNPNFTRETHIPTVSSRRRATGVRFPDFVRSLVVVKADVSDDAMSILAPLRRLSLRERSSTFAPRKDKQHQASPVCESIDHTSKTLIAVGWDAAEAIKSAARASIPSLWYLPLRPTLNGCFSPTSFQQFARRWRLLDRPYQTVFTDLHSRAWLQAGWMRPNARVVERVVPSRSDAEVAAARLTRRERLPSDAFVVAHESIEGEPESLACLHEAVAMLDEPLRCRVALLKVERDLDDLAAADLFIAQPFRDLRSEASLTALAYGVPIIGSRFLEHADLMHVGVTGLQVVELDPRSLARAIGELFHDEGRRNEMGRQARAWLASRASCQWIDGEWRDLLFEASELNVGRDEDSAHGDLAADADRAAGGRASEFFPTKPIGRT